MINRKTTLLELAGLVSSSLRAADIRAVLSGGAAVSTYTRNEYQSADLDFVCSAQIELLEEVLRPLGFVRGAKGRARYFDHPDCEWFVEFPPGPVSFGASYPPADTFAEVATPFGLLIIITPTQCVLDRLAAFHHWDDLQSLDQAVMVAQHQEIDFQEVRRWASAEGIEERKLRRFLDRTRAD